MGIHPEARKQLIEWDQNKKTGVFRKGLPSRDRVTGMLPLVVISDWMGKMYRGKPGRVTSENLFHEFFNDVENAYKEGVAVYIILVDQDLYVPARKKRTQLKRRANVKPRRGYDTDITAKWRLPPPPQEQQEEEQQQQEE